jgi:hypothetical protein
MAYEMCRQPQLGDLSSILTDVRNAISGVVGAAIRGTQVQVPIPGGGTATYDVSNPASLAALQQIVSGIRITRSPASPTQPGFRPMSIVDSIPGGWLTIAAGGVLAFMLLKRR